jgi:hypothetical protein
MYPGPDEHAAGPRRPATRAVLLLGLLALSWPGAAWAHRGTDHGPGLYLAAGVAASDVGTVVLAEAGFWFGPVLPTIIWRSTNSSANGTTSLEGGRLDLGLWPLDWISVHAGVGGGRLTYRAEGASASRTALVAGGTVTFGSKAYLNVIGFGAELLVPLGAAPSGPIPFAAAPSVMLSITFQPLILFALKS